MVSARVSTEHDHSMRIVLKHAAQYRATKFRELPLSSTQCYSVSDIIEMLSNNTASNTNVAGIYVDFSGELIPVSDEKEIELISKLACAYHNSCVRSNIQVPCK